MPLMFISAVVELKRAWRILKYGEESLNTTLKLRIWLIGVFRGANAAREYRENIEKDKSSMKLRGWYGILYGIICLAGCVVWAIVLYNALAT